MGLRRLFWHPFFIRLFNWEYWSFPAVYGPIYLIFIFYILRARLRFFFTASNPSIENGGFIMESKYRIYQQLPVGSSPLTFFFPAGVGPDKVRKAIKENGLSYPLILKPDIGMRGLAAKKIDSDRELEKFVPFFTIPFLLQEFVSFPKEAGIFYYRFPKEESGQISGVVRKEFLTVRGNGTSTLVELLKKEKRFILQLDALREEYAQEWEAVLAEGEEKILVPYGNHARGAKFLDDTELVTPELTRHFDELAKKIPGFYFGRLDIRYNSWEDLCQGKNYSIIELNGAGSEPTHMYDPKHSLFFAWKEIIRHWSLMWKISRANHQKGIEYASLREGKEIWSAHKAYVPKLEAVHKALLAAES